ncbi:MAG TPA: anti-sigma factor [Mycobacterium sp.]|jgi:anti-sigma-K factor RskA
MTEPSDFELLELATPYALDAISESERADIERRLEHAPRAVAEAFRAQVREVRETMATVSAGTAVEPPKELRQRILSNLDRRGSGGNRWRTIILAAAAALVVGLVGLSAGLALRPTATPSVAQQVFTASDVKTTSEPIPAGGTATFLYSREKRAGVLVMNNVPPPAPGTVYQMWLLGDQGAKSAGTMDANAVAPSTSKVVRDLGASTALAFTVEPGAGSAQPTRDPFAKLPLA